MKKIILIFLMVFSCIAFAQESQNPFVYDESSQEQKADPVPGNPADPIPIDNYIQVLFLAGIFTILVYAKKRNSLNSL